MPIPLSDLSAHHAALRPALEAAAARVIASGRYIMGPEVDAFEAEAALALGATDAIGLSSGTDALLVLLMALGIGPGDEVVTTPFSFFATAGAVARMGARPIFADIDPVTLNLDPARAVAVVSPRTKAVIVVHLFGRVAATDGLGELCAARGIPLIEDAAQSIGAWRGADGARVGQIGRAAALSFFPAKNLGALGDAGMVLTEDAALAGTVRQLRVHGAQRRYQHELVGGNFRLDELQAAFLRVKLPHLRDWTERRRAAVAHYRQALADLPGGLLLPPDDPGCVWNQFVVRVPGGARDRLALALAQVGTATAVYYPAPLHLQACFAHLGHGRGDFPESEWASGEVLALPLHPEITPRQIETVAAQIRSFFGA